MLSDTTLHADKVRIDFASAEQLEGLVDLLCEINAYYNPASPAARAIVQKHTLENLVSKEAPYRLVLASLPSGRIVGLAAFAFTYSIVEPEPEKSKQCQLKELYVSASVRSLGVGQTLMSWLARHALDNRCHRIDWPVKAANTRGISFYERIGARLVEDRLSYRLAEPAVTQLAARQESLDSKY